MSVSDKLKDIIYFQHELNKHLRSIIYHGNITEKEYSIMLLWQLCFSKSIADDVLNDAELYSFIFNLSANKTDLIQEDTKELQNNASGVIWILNKNKGDNTIKRTVEASLERNLVLDQTEKKKQHSSHEIDINPEDINRKHIMISYNRDSRDLCLKVKAELEKDGLLVWIDVEDICGSSLESMAKAIENSVSLVIEFIFYSKILI